MLVLFCLVSILILSFKSKGRLEAENIALRHQIMVLRRQVGDRVHLTNFDRLFLVQLYHWFPSIRRVLAGFRFSVHTGNAHGNECKFSLITTSPQVLSKR
jgi:hypothetical protein